MRAALTIAAKDLRLRLRDRSALVVSFVAPLAIAAVMSFAFRGSERFHADVGLVDLDRGHLAAAFVELTAQPGLADEITTRVYASEGEARRAVGRRDVDAAWVLPTGMTDAVTSGGTATIRTLTSADAGIAGEVARSVAQGFAGGVDAQGLAIATVLQRSTGIDAARVQAVLATLPPTEELVNEATGTRPLRAINYYGPGMAMFFALFTIGFTARSYFAEARDGMLDRIAAAPVAPLAVVAGKALSAFVLASTSLAVMGVVTTLALDAYWGPPLAAVAVCVAMAAAVTALAMLVVSVARSERQAEGFASLLVFGLALVGGNFVFLATAPRVVRVLALATPNRWALRAFMDLSTGAGAGAAVVPVLAITAVTVTAAGIAALRWRVGARAAP
jgi:ABC-2 type transport system permease protein